MNRSAIFSDCGQYRFSLSRTWSGGATLQLIGLNPSTANAESDDPTIRRIITLAKSNGYGGIVMTNLFPFITAYPKELLADDHYISRNDFVLKAVKIDCEDVCFCWGNFNFPERIYSVVEMFPDALCFGKNKNGSPKHPLYLKSETKLIKFQDHE